jgi:hypothetical protein
MGILKKLFGGKQEEPAKGPPPMKPVKRRPDPDADTVALPPVDEMDSKQLIRVLASGNGQMREDAAARLMEAHDHGSIRPLMNSYLNYGDPMVLEALTSYGSDITPAVTSEAFDLSVVGERRARLMDLLGATGDEVAIGPVRDCVDDPDKETHVRACAALARLGDLNGIALLSADLQDGQDPELRTKALRALTELDDIPDARQAVSRHVDRYLGEGGAIAAGITVMAPRLADPDTGMTDYLVNEIEMTERDLVVVTGSGAIELARTRQAELLKALKDHQLQILTPALAPEEQMDLLEAARDTASSDPEHTVLVVGALPAPSDSPPLRHFLTPALGSYTAKIIYVDPHEYGLLQDWWHYIEDRAEVDTVFDIVLSVSTPERSAISDEEYQIYQLTPDDRKDVFPRALLAHL